MHIPVKGVWLGVLCGLNPSFFDQVSAAHNARPSKAVGLDKIIKVYMVDDRNIFFTNYGNEIVLGIT